MITLFLRAFVLYIIMLLALRGMGKHQLGKFQPYEFAMAMLIADIVSIPMSDVSTPLIHGILPVAALFITHSAITIISMRSDKARAFFSGRPSVLISDGVIDRAALTKLCMSLSDLMEGLREAGILDPKTVGTAIQEANGSISAFPDAVSRPPTASEMGVQAQPEGLPLPLVMDGRLQDRNLTLCGQDDNWLKGVLGRFRLDVQDIFLCCIARDGMMHLQTMDGTTLDTRALSPEKAVW